MRSIPYTMTWELLQRGRWPTILALLGSNLLPVLILSALRMEGAFDPTDSAAITLQFVIVQLNIVTFAAAIMAVMELPPRCYSLPVPTTTLVAWRMFPSMVLIFVETLFSLTALNIAFGLDWPVWGPALVAPVALAMIQAALWYSERSPLMAIYLAAAAAIIGFWFKSRYGSVFSRPVYIWTDVTPIEVLTLIAFSIAAYAASVVGVSRSRRGDVLVCDWLTMIEVFLVRPLPWPRQGPRFRSPYEGHLWCEWTKKGVLLPGVVGFALFFALSAWLLFSRDPNEIVKGLYAGGGMLSALGLLGGLILGNCGRNDSTADIGSFLATRPLTNRDLSRVTLHVIARSVLTAWGLWLIVFASVVGLIYVSGASDRQTLLQQIKWWYFPATLVSCWIVTSCVSTIYLAGRLVGAAKVTAVLMICLIGSIFFSKLLDDETQRQLSILWQTSAGLAFVGIAIWSMTTALRRSLITVTEVIGAAGLWIGLAAATILVSVFDFSFSQGVHVGLGFLLVGIASLAVVPFAAAPLAIGWNRHR